MDARWRKDGAGKFRKWVEVRVEIYDEQKGTSETSAARVVSYGTMQNEVVDI